MIKLLSLTCWRRFAQGSFLGLALLASGGAWAQVAPPPPVCNVTLSSILPSNQAVLKADCGTASMTSITWTRDAGSVSPAPVAFGPFTFPATLADLNFTTLLTSGTHSYTASGSAGATAVPAGKAAVVTLSQPILTVGVSPGGSVTSVPAGINACTVAGGVNCAFAYDTGTTVVLTPTASSGNSFAGWGGDCVGTGNCTVSMTTLRTVTATFSTVPTFTVTGAANPSAGGAVNCTGPVTSGNTATCTVVITPNYFVTGSSSTCGGGLSGNTFTTGAVTSACTVTVNYSLTPPAPTTFTVTGNVASGSGSVSCLSPVNSGTVSTCTIVSGQGFTLTGTPTSTCGGSMFNSNAFNTGPVSSNCTVSVTFSSSTTTSPPPTSPPPPPSGACGSPDLIWNPMLASSLFPIPPGSAVGTTGTSIQFTADNATYPNGIFLNAIDESGIPLLKDFVISACAHDFTPLGGSANCSRPATPTTGFGLMFMPSASQPTAQDCQLQAGGTYYINFRPTGGAGTAHAQFTILVRQLAAPPPPGR